MHMDALCLLQAIHTHTPFRGVAGIAENSAPVETERALMSLTIT